jgi:hypothetical protein
VYLVTALTATGVGGVGSNKWRDRLYSCNRITATGSWSWRKEKQQVEVESGEREKQQVVEQSVFLIDSNR